MKKNNKKITKKKMNNITQENNEKKYIILSILFVLALLLIGISATYAFFTRRVEAPKEKTQSNVLTGVLDIDFQTNKYIHNTSTKLINDTEIFTKADKSEFVIKRSENTTVDNVAYNLYLDIIKLDNELKNEHVKWALYKELNPNADSTPISSGNFANIKDIKKIQLNQTKIDLPKNDEHNYTLYIWLSYSETELQNEFLQKELEVKISTEATTY